MNLDKQGIKVFEGPKSVRASFAYRIELCDELTCQAVFRDDEYKLVNFPPAPGEWIIDAGAHIGTFSILAAKLYPDNPILAIEPLPENIVMLRKNIALNALENKIFVLENVLWKDDGNDTPIFYRDEMKVGKVHRYIGSVCPNIDGEKSTEYFLGKSITLRKIIQEFKITRIRLLKMDVEGSESEVFEGTPLDDFKKIRTILGEYHLTDPKTDIHPRTKLFNMISQYFDDFSAEPEKASHGSFLFERKI